MKKIIFSFLTIALVACTNKSDKHNTTENNNSTNEQFTRYKENFILRMWELYPDWATGMGFHKYDSILVAPTEEFRNKEIAFCKQELDSLASYALESLDNSNKTDYYIIKSQLEGTIFGITELKSWQWNPANYNLGDAFMQVMSDKENSLEGKLKNATTKMAQIPAFYEAAKKNIYNPTIEHTNLAIQQIAGSAEVFSVSLKDSINASKLSESDKNNINEQIKNTLATIDNFVAWLQKDVLPTLNEKTARSFRLGKELHAKKFQYDIQSSYTSEEIYKKALARKTELHAEMAKLAKQLWPKYLREKAMPTSDLEIIREVIAQISNKHTTPDSFQTTIEKQIPELVKFINEKNLLYLDPSKPLVVRKEPEYMAGVAGASVSSPGPYDKNGNTYYNVGSIVSWPKDRAESYLREYNHYILQILNIHEALPGHYAQLIYSNNSPSIIKSILGNGSMVEGWAVYTERMMLEEGYGNNEAEMWLMYYKWHMRAACNTILDYSVHTLNMSKEDALNLLINEAFQEKAEAEGKWRRATLTQVQLCSYFTGYTEIYDLREEIKKQQGEKFNLKEFHEKFLSYGSAPVKYIRELMLEKNK
ncbi:MAG: DUF885 domain-containing protein [Bacteroidetes bacterium]|nr:DUF885 domain-containing protein [Bacteroidota bacterium]